MCVPCHRGGATVTDIAALGVTQNELMTIGFSYEEINPDEDA
jgi:hypothetical protein